VEQIKVFVSYPRERPRCLQEFRTHTADLERNGVLFFYDGRMRWGEAWEPRLRYEIDSAHIFVALVTAEYLASEWCMRELGQALMQMRSGRCRVLPIHVAPFDAAPESPLRVLQLLPLAVFRWLSSALESTCVSEPTRAWSRR
jgi:TIR domain-containing protein